MSLSDIMSHSDLSVYPQIALIIFLCVFATLTARIFLSRRRRETYLRAAAMPLDEGRVVHPNGEEDTSS